MVRVLTRPMFRKGGLSQETGIMSGLDRKGYAGGGNIGGGSISGTPMGSRTGFLTPYAEGWNRIYGGGSTAQNVVRPERWDWSRYGKGFRNLIGKAGTGIKQRIKGGISSLWGKVPQQGLMYRYPAVGTTVGATTGLAGPLAAYAYGAHKLQKSLPEQLTGEGGIAESSPYSDPMAAGADISPNVDRILRGEEIDIEGKPLVPKKNEIENKVIREEENLKKKSDLETIYGDLLPMIERELGADPDDTKRQLYVQLAQAGANLLAEPGGDLVGAIGKATKGPISAVGKVLDKESATDREAKILAFKLAADRASPGEMGKLIQDLKNNDFTQQEINSIIQNRQPGSGYRANVAFEETKELRTELQDEFNKKIEKGKSVPLSTAKDLKFAQDNFGMSISDFKVLPKKEERVPGEYYFNPKDRTLGRLSKDGKTLIKPSEPGFMDQTA